MEKHCVKATCSGVTSVICFLNVLSLKHQNLFFFRYGTYLNVTHVRQHLYIFLGEVRFTSML